jgi:hypothetical protein
MCGRACPSSLKPTSFMIHPNRTSFTLPSLRFSLREKVKLLW